MNYTPLEKPKKLDYEQVHKDVTKFLNDLDEFEKISRENIKKDKRIVRQQYYF